MTFLIKPIHINRWYILFFLFGYCSSISSLAQQKDSTKLNIADIITIHSNVLNQDRKIYIYLPDSNKVAYFSTPLPVLYLMDGDEFTALVASQVEYLEEFGEMPDMLIVGIDNHDYRSHDLTPVHDLVTTHYNPNDTSPMSANTTGGGDSFLQFVKNEVMPYVEARYKTAPYKILSGHSLGGLLAVYCLTIHPDMFNAYIATSPSLWRNNGYEVRRAENMLGQRQLKNKCFFFSDGNEGGRFHEDIVRLDSLLGLKKIDGLRYKYVAYPEESHESEPVKAELDALRFIYPKWNPSPTDTTMALLKSFYEQLSSVYGYKILPPENLIIESGHDFLNTNETNIAIQFFEFNVSIYPSSFNAYDGLGDCYAKKGDKIDAIVNYEKAIALNPKAEETKRKLKAIKKLK